MRERKVLGTDFCPRCREERPYYKIRVWETAEEEGVTGRYQRTVFCCTSCGEWMDTTALWEINNREYRLFICKKKGLLSEEEMETLLAECRQEMKREGMPEDEVRRYLKGLIPSKERSELGRRILRERFAFSKKLELAVDRILREVRNVTPLKLQKLLFFLQGLSLCQYEQPFFPEDCEAWVHGPVYRKVYERYRRFGYHAIPKPEGKNRDESKEPLTEKEEGLLREVCRRFGDFPAKELEMICHENEAWKEARNGLLAGTPGNRKIKKERIRNSFPEMAELIEKTVGT